MEAARGKGAGDRISRGSLQGKHQNEEDMARVKTGRRNGIAEGGKENRGVGSGGRRGRNPMRREY